MKAKEKFEEWYNKKEISVEIPIAVFNMGLPDSMKWGVYLEFFDSEGIYIDFECSYVGFSFTIWTRKEDGLIWEFDHKLPFETRQQAQTEAINKAFLILEERL